MIRRTYSRFHIECADELRVMKHFLLHACVLPANGAINYRLAGIGCDASSRSRRYCAVNNGESRLILLNVLDNLCNELLVTKREANVHYIALLQRRCQINIDAENLMPCLNDLR